MREIKTLLQQLHSYPQNFFTYPDKRRKDLTEEVVEGLTVCDLDGNFKGFIETGTNDGEVVTN